MTNSITLADIFSAGSTLPTDFLARRREALVIAHARQWLGSTEPISVLPAYPGVYRPVPDGRNERLALMESAREEHRAAHLGTHYKPTPPDMTKPPLERLATMIRKATLLMAEIKSATLLTTFNHKRQQYYSLCSEARRYARAHGLSIPDLPIAPISHFPNARPRNRWLNLGSVV